MSERPIGWVMWDPETKSPYRAARSGYYRKPDNGYHPPRIYSTEQIAHRYAVENDCIAAEVFVRVPDEG